MPASPTASQILLGDLHFSSKNSRKLRYVDLMPQLKSEHLILSGSRFNVHSMELVGDDGKTYTREVIRHPGAVVLLPLLDRDHVVMIENHRPTVAKTLLELPAGTREPNEPAERTAARELTEETGYHAGKLELIHEFYSAPGICDELMSLYIARDLTLGEPDREAVEQITNRVASRKEIADWVSSGMIRDAKTLIGLYAFLHSDRL
jgi:ADP-ribose pyrophosphatase